jgi:hypothetical protein
VSAAPHPARRYQMVRTGLGERGVTGMAESYGALNLKQGVFTTDFSDAPDGTEFEKTPPGPSDYHRLFRSRVVSSTSTRPPSGPTTPSSIRAL